MKGNRLPIFTEGRPDFGNHDFGKTVAKKHPEWAYSAQGILVHKIREVELHWWECVDGGDRLQRLNKPKVIIRTICGTHIFTEYAEWSRKTGKRGAMCETPSKDAVICGRCTGTGPIWGKNSKAVLTKKEARKRLGCIVSVEEKAR